MRRILPVLISPARADLGRAHERPAWSSHLLRAQAIGRRPAAVDVGLLALAVGVWFGEGWLPVLGLLAVGGFWWRRRALGERAVSPLYRPIGVLVALGILALLP